MVGNEIAVAGFLETARVPAEEFEAAMTALRETMLGRRPLAGSLGGGELLVLAFLLFVLHVAADTGQDLAVLGEHGIQDAAA
ncbi:MAG: hypothetical protein O3C40_37665 [Planctomycetota bacterium]|nr:hypothetical protein [Planctomycetota bacterium]